MSVKYTNTKNKIYYLHKGKTSTGKDKYYFSMKAEGLTSDSIPNGYEIYETPNSQVFLRKIQKKIISDKEKEFVVAGMKRFSSLKLFKIDVKKNKIVVYTPDQDVDELENIFSSPSSLSVVSEKIANEIVTYSPNMQFVLTDKGNRIFVAQRYCYLGRVDDWISIGGSGLLDALIKKYVKHLGKESFFDLH